jgi:hypothetical protein
LLIISLKRRNFAINGGQVQLPKLTTSGRPDFSKSKSLRNEAASLLQQEDVKCPILVDTMDNKCSLAYGAFPERYYIIHNGKIVLFNGLGPEFYDPSKVKLWVESYMKSS